MSVDENNRHLKIDRNFLIEIRTSRAIRYAGRSKDVTVWKEIAIIGNSCLATDAVRIVSTVKFEGGPTLTKIL
jgi:hypothetical protein